MPIHDETGSCVNLAKAMLRDMDRASIDTVVRTATLAMLLDKLIELGTPEAPVLQAAAAKTVAERLKAFDTSAPRG